MGVAEATPGGNRRALCPRFVPPPLPRSSAGVIPGSAVCFMTSDAPRVWRRTGLHGGLSPRQPVGGGSTLGPPLRTQASHRVRAGATPQAGAPTTPGTRLSGARGLHTDNQLCWAVEKGSLAPSTGVKAGAACWRPLWQNQPEREGTGLWTEQSCLSGSAWPVLQERDKRAPRGEQKTRTSANWGLSQKSWGHHTPGQLAAGESPRVLAWRHGHTSCWREETGAGPCRVHAKAGTYVCTWVDAGSEKSGVGGEGEKWTL